MKKKMIRPLLRSGKSAVVVIPKWWVELNGLNIGDDVEVIVNPKLITIRPPKGGGNELLVEK